MTKQNTVTLNLTKAEYECLCIMFEGWSKNTYLNISDTKPCKPFIDKLRTKLQPKK